MKNILLLFLFISTLFANPSIEKQNSKYLKLLKSRNNNDVIRGITLLSKNKQLKNYQYLVPFLKNKNFKIVKTTLLAFSEYPAGFNYVNDEIFYNLKSRNVEIRRLAALVIPYSINSLQVKGIEGKKIIESNKETLKKAIYDKDDIVKKNLIDNHFFISPCFPIQKNNIFLDLLKDKSSQIQLEILNSFFNIISVNEINKYQNYLFNNKNPYVVLKLLEIIKQKRLQKKFQKQIKKVADENKNSSVQTEATLLLKRENQNLKKLIETIFDENTSLKTKKKTIDSFHFWGEKGKSALLKIIQKKNIDNKIFFHCLERLYFFFPKTINKKILFISIARAKNSSYNLITKILLKNFKSFQKDSKQIIAKLLEKESPSSRLTAIEILKSTNYYQKKLSPFLYDMIFDDNLIIRYNTTALIINKKIKDYLEFIEINLAEESGEVIRFMVELIIINNDQKTKKILKKYIHKFPTYKKNFSKKENVKNWYEIILSLSQKSTIYEMKQVKKQLIKFIKKKFNKQEILKIRIKANAIGDSLYFDLKE